MKDPPREDDIWSISSTFFTIRSFFTAHLIRQQFCRMYIGKCFPRLIVHWSKLYLIIIAKM